MRKTVLTSIAVLALATACSNKNKSSPSSQSSLTDLNPPPQPVHTQTASSTPVTPVVPVAYENTPAAEPTATSGKSYTVKRGDTLWSIAQRTYGDGKQYRKIVAANPGIQGDQIKVGQTLVLP